MITTRGTQRTCYLTTRHLTPGPGPAGKLTLQTQLKLNTAKKATTLGKQRNITPREPIGTNASPGTGTNTRPTPFNRMIDIPGWNIGLDDPVNNGWWDNELNDLDGAGPSSSATRPTNNFNTNAPQNLTQASNSNA